MSPMAGLGSWFDEHGDGISSATTSGNKSLKISRHFSSTSPIRLLLRINAFSASTLSVRQRSGSGVSSRSFSWPTECLRAKCSLSRVSSPVCDIEAEDTQARNHSVLQAMDGAPSFRTKRIEFAKVRVRLLERAGQPPLGICASLFVGPRRPATSGRLWG